MNEKASCYKDTGPDTKIRLAELSDEHLAEVTDVYKSLGLLCDPDPFQYTNSEAIKREIKEMVSSEVRPFAAIDTGKILIGERKGEEDGKKYVHVQISINTSFRGLHPAYKNKPEAFSAENMEGEFREKIRERLGS